MKPKNLIPVILIPIIVIAVAVILFFALSSGGDYSGTVTFDGKGMENVSVSDGRNVVKTDENGTFTLKGYRKTRFITVTVPAGYQTEKYYIPAEKGRHDGYDFELAKSSIAPGEAHSFLNISDTEVGENGVGEWINYLQDMIKENKPAFLIHTGDICYEAGLKQHIKDMNSENMGVPVKYIIGNHDYVDGKYGEELFESIYGPVWYSFEVGNVHYIVTPFQTGGDYKSGYNKNDRWRWLENDLANTDKDMKIVMFNHTKAPSDDYVISFDRKELDLKEHNLIAWIYGHYHDSRIVNNNGVLDICTARPDCGGIDSSVSGARIVYISEDGTVTSKMTYYHFNGKAPKIANAKWSAKVNGNPLFCDTVIDSGKVYIATNDENYPINCGITCLDAESGKELWYYQTVNSVKNNVKITDGKLVTQDCEGNVYCLNAENGEEIWKTKLTFDYAISTSSGICIDSDSVFAGTPDSVYALNLADGKIKWKNIRGHGEPSPAEFIVAGDKLIVSSHWDALIALDTKTGKQIWENKDEDIRFRSSTPVQVDNNTLLVADSDAIMLVDLSSGEITTKKNYDDKYNFASSAQPYIKDNKAFIPTAKNGLIIFDLNKKEIVKEVEVGEALIYTAPYTNSDAQTIEPTLVENPSGNLVFGASDGVLYTIDTDGNILNKTNIGAPIFGSVAFDGDYAVVADFSGRVSSVLNNIK
ncbi:MAG: PQQ-binding-like beta-propeller repeat protein [Clostridia bacterium]|nr:PQQ-binding-like beta-propeller repeat protein [Clostridia bacterium]